MTRRAARDEIRVTSLRTLPGKNYWARGPVTRLDLALGAYDELSSAEVPGLTDRLADALPGLAEHGCSVGGRGGFLTRLRRGTYAAHIAEHVAIELQVEQGDEVSYGRTRGGARRGEYVVAFSHAHAAVGAEAALGATAIVRAAFDGAPLPVNEARAALVAARARPDEPPPTDGVACALCASGPWRPLADALSPRVRCEELAVVPPGDLVERGLPYAHARVAVVPVVDRAAAPAGFDDPDRVDRLYTVFVDGLARDGLLLCPSRAAALIEYARDRGRRVETVDADRVDDVARRVFGELDALTTRGSR